MKKVDFTLRPIKVDDIPGAVKLSNAEGWNQTEKDWKLLIENPENVGMLAEHDKEIIGTTTAINYSNRIAWIGMVLVNKEYRGRGVSKSLLTDIFKRLESCKSIKLDATPDGQQVYKKLDFKDEYLVDRMTTKSMKDLQLDNNNMVPVQIQEKDIDNIILLDELVFGANRAQLIKWLIKEYPHKAWLLKQDDRITGFVLGRDGTKFHQVGPLAASNTTEAKLLVAKALAKLTNQSVVVDVPDEKDDLIDWLRSIGFVKQRHFIRMYKKENPFRGMTDKQYLICGPEFG